MEAEKDALDTAKEEKLSTFLIFLVPGTLRSPLLGEGVFAGGRG
jgi:hypothetical protein